MKKSLILLLVLGMIIQIFPDNLWAESFELINIYEAEQAVFITNRSNKKDQNASNGEAIFLPEGKINGVEAFCKFTFYVEKAGLYNLSINSWGIGAIKKNYLDIDGVRLQDTYLVSPENVWQEHNFLSYYYLEEGEHSVTVTSAYGYTYLDYLKVEMATELNDKIYDKQYELSNKNATYKTQELFKYLQKSYGNYILSGQFTEEGFSDSSFQRIKDKTGKLPAIMGLDLLAVTPSIKELSKYWLPNPNFDKVIESAIEYSDLGGIITFCWHWNLDFSFMKKDENGEYVNAWSAYRPAYVNIDFKKVMENEDSIEYKLLERDMDAIATELSVLSEKDIPILFRPLHEASGEWFWWNTGGKDAYIKLWRKMYDKFTNEYKLNNLIWVWNGSDANWYPGDEYVDICGADIYGERKDYNAHAFEFNKYMGFMKNEKMLALSEVGTLIDIDEALAKNAIWSWFMNWSWVHVIPEEDSEDSYTSLEMWNKVYNHEKVVTLDKLPFHVHSDNNKDDICDICGSKIIKDDDQENNDKKEDEDNSGDNSSSDDNNDPENNKPDNKPDDKNNPDKIPDNKPNDKNNSNGSQIKDKIDIKDEENKNNGVNNKIEDNQQSNDYINNPIKGDDVNKNENNINKVENKETINVINKEDKLLDRKINYIDNTKKEYFKILILMVLLLIFFVLLMAFIKRYLKVKRNY